MNELETTYRPGGRVVVRKLGDETLLVPISGAAAGARVYPVNAEALTVWNCLAAGGTVHRAAERLTEQFAVTMEEALTDSIDCARAFAADALLEVQKG